MAEFGMPATQLQEAKGEGARVLSPVETPNIGANPLFNIVGKVVDVFSQGLQNDAKAKAEERKQSIVGQFVRTMNTINDGVATGELDAGRAGTQYRSTFKGFTSSYPEYIKDFEEASKALRGNTDQESVETQLKNEREQRRVDIAEASKSGFKFYAGMDKLAEDSQILAHKSSVKAQQELRDFYQRAEYDRATYRFNKDVSEQEAKDLSTRLVSNIAGDNLTAFQALIVDLGNKVRTNPAFAPDAQNLLLERYSNIAGALRAAAMANPELAAPYNALFQQMFDNGKNIADPKFNAENFKAQADSIINQAKVYALSRSPKLLAGTVINQLVPGVSPLITQLMDSARDGFNLLAIRSPTESDKVPPIVGSYDPDLEKQVYKVLTEALKPVAKDNPLVKEEIAKGQQANAVNNLLLQTGKLLETGQATPAKLQEFAKFMATPEFGKWMAERRYDPAIAAAAMRTMQMYTEGVSNTIQTKMNSLVGITDFKAAVNSEPGNEKGVIKLSDTVDIVFNGAGVSFVPRKGVKMDAQAAREQATVLRDLQGVSGALNQLIRIGAHGEGHQDYAKVWSENKHLFLPNIFKAPETQKAPASKMTTEADIKREVNAVNPAATAGYKIESPEYNISEIEKELKNATNPMIRKILEEELARIKGKK